MPSTLVIQSHRQPLPATWIQSCIDSVKEWSKSNNFEYKFLGDELFEYVDERLIEKTKKQLVIATDLARLKVLQEYLSKGYDTVVWFDADFFVFLPEKLQLIEQPYAIGREVWVQASQNKLSKLEAKTKVHNAFLMFRKGNVFLDFYADAAERLLIKNQGSMPPQFIGPKLLTALHNIVQCPVQETAGMLSPLVVKDIVNGNGSALQLLQSQSSRPLAAANLCSSLYRTGEVNAEQIEQCMNVLISDESLSF